jgi:hypothetical protein
MIFPNEKIRTFTYAHSLISKRKSSGKKSFKFLQQKGYLREAVICKA